MSVSDLYETHSVHHWLQYSPNESHYYRFPLNVVASCFKIVDVYESFCYARSSLLDTVAENYGELVGKDELSKTFVRSKFITSALAYYNYCIDFSWQVPWWLHSTPTFDIIYNENYFITKSGECTYRALEQKFKGTTSDVWELIKEFMSQSEVKPVRDQYNRVKHRSMPYYPGLGIQNEYACMGINNHGHKLLTRELMDHSEWSEKLIQYDIAFKSYFEKLIELTVPNDYLDGNWSVEMAFTYDSALQEYLTNTTKSGMA